MLCENLWGGVRQGVDCVVGAFGPRMHRNTKQELFEAYSVDECYFAMSRKTWEKYKFNIHMCDGWHLYAVELCLRLRGNGGIVLVGEGNIKHFSNGDVDDNYMKTYKKLIIAYKGQKIVTTCKNIPANLTIFYLYYLLWKIKKVLFKNYPLINTMKQIVRKVRNENIDAC